MNNNNNNNNDNNNKLTYNKYNFYIRYVRWWIFAIILFSVIILILYHVYNQSEYLYIETINPADNLEYFPNMTESYPPVFLNFK